MEIITWSSSSRKGRCLTRSWNNENSCLTTSWMMKRTFLNPYRVTECKTNTPPRFFNVYLSVSAHYTCIWKSFWFHQITMNKWRSAKSWHYKLNDITMYTQWLFSKCWTISFRISREGSGQDKQEYSSVLTVCFAHTKLLPLVQLCSGPSSTCIGWCINASWSK